MKTFLVMRSCCVSAKPSVKHVPLFDSSQKPSFSQRRQIKLRHGESHSANAQRSRPTDMPSNRKLTSHLISGREVDVLSQLYPEHELRLTQQTIHSFLSTSSSAFPLILVDFKPLRSLDQSLRRLTATRYDELGCHGVSQSN